MADIQIFENDRKYIKSLLDSKDSSGQMVIAGALSQPLFCKNKDGIYMVVGINSSYINDKYIEIFVSVDITETMKKFDESAVKVFYFNGKTLNETTEITEADARSGYARPEWRRVQKYIEKQKKQIINSADYSKIPSPENMTAAGLSNQNGLLSNIGKMYN